MGSARASLPVTPQPGLDRRSGGLAPASCERPYFRARRSVELLAGALALLAPLFALIALVVLLHQGGPVLLRQAWAGRGMRPFTIYKFRTVGAPCDARGAPVPDPERTSPLGRLLRRTRQGELPQLLNSCAAR